MRCPICDYAPGMPDSAYHSSLALPKARSIHEDPSTGEIICNCFNSDIYYIDMELSEPEDFDPNDVSMEVGDEV